MAIVTRVRVGIAAFATVFAVVALWLSLPLLLSTELVRSTLAREIATWTGHDVRIDSQLQLRLWPTLRARIDRVAIFPNGQPEATPLATVETMEADVSLRALLGGNVRFTDFRLVRPKLNLIERPDGGFSWVEGGGRFDIAFDRAVQALAENPAAPDRATLWNVVFATFDIDDGAVTIRRNAWRLAEEITAISGRFSWPRLDRATIFEGSGVWRGEQIGIDMTMDDLLLAAAGGRSELELAISSPLLTLGFEGSVSAGSDFFAEGDVRLATPSLRRLLNWTRADISPGQAIGSLSVDADLVAGQDRFRFEDARIVLDGNTGTGAFEIARKPEARPSVSGTLDFDTLDVSSFLAAFLPLPNLSDPDRAVDLSALEQIDLDLRLSADRANAGPLVLEKVAAAAQIRSGQAIFDIGDAMLAGGEVTARLQLGGYASAQPKLHAIVMATGVDTATIARSMPLPPVVPRAVSTASLDVKAPLTHWRDVLEKASGTASITTGPGTVGGFDVEALLKKAAESGVLGLETLGDAEIRIDGLTVAATFGEGSARLGEARIVQPGRTITLSGVVPYLSRSLALSGRIDAETPESGAPSAFFIGGSWSRPYLVPAPARAP